MKIIIRKVDEENGALLVRCEDERDANIGYEYNVDIPIDQRGIMLTDPVQLRQYVAGFFPNNMFTRAVIAKASNLSALQGLVNDSFTVNRGVMSDVTKAPPPPPPPGPVQATDTSCRECALPYKTLITILVAKGIILEEDLPAV